jgi:predicted kinase
LQALTEEALENKRAIIEDRAQREIPRDTHGDLRLDHIYWFAERRPPDDWVIVDCIEFNERFRHADPIAEVAFLAMELTLEGRGEDAHTFVEAYLRASGDDEGRVLLPFYRAYRAAVRGKVEGMKAAGNEITVGDRKAAITRARARWLFALSELEVPRGKPCLVMVGGLPGSGKSTLSRRLSEEADFTVIRSDVVRKELTADTERPKAQAGFGSGFYTADWNTRTYEECLRQAEDVLFDGSRVLVDASFHDESRRRLFLDAARQWGVPACLILCQADPSVVRERLAKRRGDASDADWPIHDELARHWDELSARTRSVTYHVDTGGSLIDSTGQAIEALRRAGVWAI